MLVCSGAANLESILNFRAKKMGIQGRQADIKVLPEEGVSVQIGGETYNPAFPCGPPPI